MIKPGLNKAIKAKDLEEHIKILKRKEASILDNVNNELSRLNEAKKEYAKFEAKKKADIKNIASLLESAELKERMANEKLVSIEEKARFIDNYVKQEEEHALRLRADSNKLLAEHDNKISESETRLENIKSEIKRKESLLDELDTKVKDRNDDLLNSEQKISDYSESINKIRNDSKAAQDKINKEIKELTIQFKKESDKVADRKDFIESAYQAIEQKNKQLEEKEKNLMILSSRLQKQLDKFLPGVNVKL